MKRGLVLWLTGLPAAGKTTLAEELNQNLKDAVVLDGDVLRRAVSKDLGFSRADRITQASRTGRLAREAAEEGKTVIVALVSPYHEARNKAREIIGPERFLEVYVKCDVDECIRRDPKGMYAKALAGEIDNFTGVSAPYEEPLCPDLVIDTADKSVEESVKMILSMLERKKL